MDLATKPVQLTKTQLKALQECAEHSKKYAASGYYWTPKTMEKLKQFGLVREYGFYFGIMSYRITDAGIAAAQ